jgi:RNA polymerase primary sigma factor
MTVAARSFGSFLQFSFLSTMPRINYFINRWIQQAVFRSIAYHSRTIRLPVHIHNMLHRIRKVRSNLQQGLGRVPTDEEMADALDMRPSKYKRMLLLTRRSISLELPKYLQNPKDQGFEGEDSLADLATSTGRDDTGFDNVSPERTVDRSLFHEDLREMLKMLTKEERTVISLRYGLADGLTRTITSVAAQLKQTPGAVRSHESKALRKLRRPWYEKKLDEHCRSLLG